MENNEQFDLDLDAFLASLSLEPFEDKMDEPAEPIEASAEVPLDAPQAESEAPVEPEPETEEQKAKKAADSWQKTVLMYMHDLIYLLGALMILSLLLVRIVVVSGSSMNRTLLDGDYLFVLSNTFYHKPENGDVVVVSKDSFDNGKPIVKRVIATEGQWVMIKDGIVYVGETRENTLPLDEDYTTTATVASNDFSEPVQVPEGCIFCLGDNRIVSHDSRSPDIGMIDENEVLGKVLFLFLPGCDKDALDRPIEPRDFGRIGVVD